jgi:K+-sensing histidine kinase KdpD
MASIIVLLPVYLFLMQLIRRDIVRDASRKDIWVRRWALILTLFVAGVTITIDLITLLTTFLNGETITTAFLLKVLVILLVAGGVFAHFSADLKGYWDRFPMRRRYVAIGVAALAAVTIVAGFFIVGTPAQARLARYDAQKVSDLQNIQSQITSYYQAKQKLPSAITDLNNSLNYGPVPIDPQTNAVYEYATTGALSFKLCADFNAASRGNQQDTFPRAIAPAGVGIEKIALQDNWQHGAGQVCFDRTIDPAFYPPMNKVQP